MQNIAKNVVDRIPDLPSWFVIASFNKADGAIQKPTPHEILKSSELYNFLAKNKILNSSVFFSGNVHGNRVEYVSPPEAVQIAPQRVQNADALVTRNSNIVLCTTTADCIPMVFVDRVNKAIGIAHAGWRGVLNGVCQNTVRALEEFCGSNPVNISVYFGPSIKSCCFQVREDTLWRFQHSDWFTEKSLKTNTVGYSIDLHSMLRTQLVQLGIPNSLITESPDCTCCSPAYFSHRREAGSRRGSNCTAVTIVNQA
jgi:polyphenol oxidase